MGILFLLLTLFLLVILKITSESVNGFGYDYGFSLEGFATAQPVGDFLIVKAEWCGHCQRAKPEFEKLVQMGALPIKSGEVLKIRILDSDVDKEEVSKLGVRGFPTLMARIKGKTYEYPGERTAEGVKQYLADLSL